MSDDLISNLELPQIANRALKFQRYIFRRAWGVYYAVWAAAIAAFSFGYLFINLLGNVPWFFYAIFYGGVSIAAGVASLAIFTNAARTANLRSVLRPNSNTRWEYRLMGIWWIAFYIMVAVAFTYFVSFALTILYVMLFSVAGFVYYQLQFTFEDKIPIEGKLAVIAYVTSDAISLVATLFVPTNFVVVALAWSATVIVWLFSALYSLRRAPEELLVLSY